MTKTDPKDRLEYLRAQLRAERISYDELHELQSLAADIDPGDVELLEAAGVPECAEPSPFRPSNHPLKRVTRCPNCKRHAVSLPAYPGDYFDCELCGHSWPTTDKQKARMLKAPSA